MQLRLNFFAAIIGLLFLGSYAHGSQNQQDTSTVIILDKSTIAGKRVIGNGKNEVWLWNLWFKTSSDGKIAAVKPGTVDSYLMVVYQMPFWEKDVPRLNPVSKEIFSTKKTSSLESVQLIMLNEVEKYLSEKCLAASSRNNIIKTGNFRLATNDGSIIEEFDGPSLIEIYRYVPGKVIFFGQSDAVTLNTKLSPVSTNEVANMLKTYSAKNGYSPKVGESLAEKLFLDKASVNGTYDFWVSPPLYYESDRYEGIYAAGRSRMGNWWENDSFHLLFNPNVGVVGRSFCYFFSGKGSDFVSSNRWIFK